MFTVYSQELIQTMGPDNVDELEKIFFAGFRTAWERVKAITADGTPEAIAAREIAQAEQELAQFFQGLARASAVSQLSNPGAKVIYDKTKKNPLITVAELGKIISDAQDSGAFTKGGFLNPDTHKTPPVPLYAALERQALKQCILCGGNLNGPSNHYCKSCQSKPDAVK